MIGTRDDAAASGSRCRRGAPTARTGRHRADLRRVARIFRRALGALVLPLAASTSWTVAASSEAGAAPGVVIDESFNGSAASFAPAGGTWALSGGRYVLTTSCTRCSGANRNKSTHKTKVGSDFTLTVDAGTVAGTAADDYSVLFGYQDVDNYYFANLSETNSTSTSGIFVVRRGVLKQLADITALTADGAISHIAIRRAGKAIRVYRNGQLLATAADGTFTSGKVGLGSKDNRAAFDNLVVQSGAVPASERVLIGAQAYDVAWIRHYGFNGGDLADWTREGTSTFAESGGRLNVGGLGTQATLWNERTDLPANLIVRYRFKAGAETGNKRNFNQFSHALENDGSSPVGRRSGVYCSYQAIRNYLVTFTFDHSRLRRDPIPSDLGCPTEDPRVVRSAKSDKVQPNREYSIVYAVLGGRVRYYVDGRLVHDWADPSPLPAGFFALRTFETNGWWDDIEFGRLIP